MSRDPEQPTTAADRLTEGYGSGPVSKGYGSGTEPQAVLPSPIDAGPAGAAQPLPATDVPLPLTNEGADQ